MDTPQEKNVVARLFASRKFVIATIVIVTVGVLVALGKASFQQFYDLVKWVGSTLIAAIAAEDVAEKHAPKVAPLPGEFVELAQAEPEPRTVVNMPITVMSDGDPERLAQKLASAVDKAVKS